MAEAGRVVVGIDPGSIVTGYCALRVRGLSYELLVLESLKLGKGEKVTRLNVLGARLQEILERDHPDSVAVEKGAVHGNPKFAVSALVTSEARGVCLYAAARSGAIVHEVAVQSARAGLGAAGFAQKREEGKRRVLYMVTQLLHPKYAPDEDAADAAALAIWMANETMKAGALTFPPE